MGVGLCFVRVSGPIMLAQYFKKRRLYVEFISQFAVGVGKSINILDLKTTFNKPPF